MSDSTYPIPEEIAATIDREWQRLAAPGTWWQGNERVAIAKSARAARNGEPLDDERLDEPTRSAIARVATSAHTVDAATLDAWRGTGVDSLRLVELLAIVAKTAAIDTFLEGIGTEARQLPAAEEGEPSCTKVEGATINHGWLPTKGPAGAPNCFSAVDAEHRAMHELHGSFYLALTEMREMNLVKDLHRSQIELLAARTSYLNDCFY